MFGLGFTEILFLLFLALVLIGPKQLPEVARTLGRFLRELKRTTNVLTEEMKHSIDKESNQKSPSVAPPSMPPAENEAEEKGLIKKDKS